MDDLQPCPECRVGRCHNCPGVSWDVETDQTITCPCEDAGHEGEK